jgi:hypothetical protein
MYAGSVLHYKQCLEVFRTEDFEYEYLGRNRMGWMGDGFTGLEEEGGDLGFYVKK